MLLVGPGLQPYSFAKCSPPVCCHNLFSLRLAVRSVPASAAPWSCAEKAEIPNKVVLWMIIVLRWDMFASL